MIGSVAHFLAGFFLGYFLVLIIGLAAIKTAGRKRDIHHE